MVDYTSRDTVMRAAKALLAEDAGMDAADITDEVWGEESPRNTARHITEARRVLTVLQTVRDIEAGR